MEAGFIPVHGGNAGSAAPPAVMAPPANVIRAPGLKRGKMEEAISDRVSGRFLYYLVNKRNRNLLMSFTWWSYSIHKLYFMFNSEKKASAAMVSIFIRQ